MLLVLRSLCIVMRFSLYRLHENLWRNPYAIKIVLWLTYVFVEADWQLIWEEFKWCWWHEKVTEAQWHGLRVDLLFNVRDYCGINLDRFGQGCLAGASNIHSRIVSLPKPRIKCVNLAPCCTCTHVLLSSCVECTLLWCDHGSSKIHNTSQVHDECKMHQTPYYSISSYIL